MHQMRAVSLTGYLEVANFVGLDGRRMLRQSGISGEMLEDPENRIPAAAVIQLLERSADESGCDSFGLLMAEARSFASLGPLSLLLERLPNVRQMIRAAMAFQRQLNDVVLISLEEHDDTCLLRLDLAPGYWGVQAYDHIVGMAYRVLTTASGNRWKPACVHLMRPAPEDMTVWRRFFSVGTEFDDAFNGLSSSTQALLVPNPLANEEMARHARRLLHLLPPDTEPGQLSDRVRRLITLLLPSGRATLEQAASQLGVSSRSLQRQLEYEGHRFADLLNAVRRELAAAYLAGTGRPITAVAAQLGYASPGSFTRWFASEFGVSPQAWRNERTAADKAGPPPTWKP